eukprot:UN16902
MGEDENLHWHFDCNNCAITLGIQKPLEGGEIEFVPNIGRNNINAISNLINEDETMLARTKSYHTEEGT